MQACLLPAVTIRTSLLCRSATDRLWKEYDAVMDQLEGMLTIKPELLEQVHRLRSKRMKQASVFGQQHQPFADSSKGVHRFWPTCVPGCDAYQVPITCSPTCNVERPLNVCREFMAMSASRKLASSNS
jgi:hypothetical protein